MRIDELDHTDDTSSVVKTTEEHHLKLLTIVYEIWLKLFVPVETIAIKTQI